MILKKFNNSWPWVLIFLITAAFGLYVRFYPLRANIWSDNNEKATALVIAKIRLTLAEQIAAQSADLTEADRNSLLEERFAKTLHDDSSRVKKAIREVAKSIQAQTSDGKGHIYLQEADGYYYYDLTQNIIRTGRLGGPVKGSKFLNEQMAAPFGFWQPINLHPYFGFLVYKILHFFQPNISVMSALCWTGPLLSLFALGAFIWCCRTLNFNPLATLIGSFYFYLAPIFVKRSTFAWNDDDSYNLIFPILIFAMVFKGLSKISKPKDGFVYGALTSILLAIYSLFWHGWGYTFAILCVSGILIFLIHLMSEKKFKPSTRKIKPGTETLLTKNLIVFFGSLWLGTPLLMSIFFGPKDFITLLQEGFSGLQKLTVNQVSLWPNLFVAVGELKASSPNEIISMTGNLFWWLVAIGGIFWVSWQCLRTRDRLKTYQLIILVVALLADLKITLSAERFILLCLIPAAILGTLGINAFIISFRKFIHPQSLNPGKPKPVEIIVGLIATLLICYFPVRSINAQIPELLNPIFNATWEQALLDINNKTPKDSIVTSWWPPGHFIKAVGDRRVTFDGATITQNKEAYWVANIFLTSNEREAAGIMRMLNTSGVESLEFLESQGMKTSDAVSLLHFILAKSQNESEEFLKRIMPASSAQKLLSLTHTSPPPSYLLVYTELMDKNIGLQFVAKWNFYQMEELNKNPAELKKLPPANSPAFFQYLWNTMGGPFKYSEALISVGQSEGKINFTEGLSVDPNTMDVTIQSSKFGSGIPKSIIYLDGESIKEKEFRNHNLNYSVVFFKENTKYYCRLMDQELARSLLAKMYFFKGKGLEYFTPISIQSSMTGRDEIFVFELHREKLL